MRSRLVGLLLFASVLAWSAGACTFAGVSTVYMSIDTGGAQRRTIFYTDSSAIYCIAKFSSAKQDATLDFTIKQIGVYPWCSALKFPTRADEQTSDVYNIFAIGEQTPGPGTETVVAEELLPNGVGSSIMCPGYIAPNLPSGNICGGSGGATRAAACVGEGIEYESEGADSGGPGFTCCASLVQGSSSTMMPSTIPYPAGLYSCDVTLDGVPAGSTEFTVEYPTYPNSSCPAPTVSNKNHTAGFTNVPCFCPEAPPIGGIPCYNWVPEGAGCPNNDTDVLCVCQESGVWECE